jgi:uncharacterized protein
MALLMTVGVYGFVAGIVKLDDAGLWLSRQASSAAQALGRGIVAAAPWLMKALSVAGTAAMFLVGGGILVHGWPWLHHVVEQMVAPHSGWFAAIAPTLADGVAGLVAGVLVLVVVMTVKRLRA